MGATNQQRKILTPEQFKALVKENPSPAEVKDAVIRKQYVAEVKAVEGEDRVLQFAITTGSVDRDTDIIDVDGWDTENYRKNPVLLWAHHYGEPPVGKSLQEWKADGALHSKAEFTPEDINPFGHMVYRMYQEGYLNAVSVGFRALKWAWNEDRGFLAVDFEEQELLEYSAVPVPANPEALVEARGKGIDTTPLLEWAEKVLDEHHEEPGLWIPRKRLEKVASLIGPQKTISIPAGWDAISYVKGTEDEPEWLVDDGGDDDSKSGETPSVSVKVETDDLNSTLDRLEELIKRLQDVFTKTEEPGAKEPGSSDDEDDEPVLDLADDDGEQETDEVDIDENEISESVRSVVQDMLRQARGEVD